MNCTSCQHENSSSARFCEACGTRLLLGKLALKTGKHSEARESLGKLYAGITEGHEMGRMREAKALLASLG